MGVLKTFAFFLLLPCVQSCLGQSDGNLIATGDWSEEVESVMATTATRGGDSCWLRGRLVVYDDQSQTAGNHARVFLELQHVFHGEWGRPAEVYFDLGSNELHFDLRNAHDEPIPTTGGKFGGADPSPFWVTLPCESSVRLRADTYFRGHPWKPEGLEILVNGMSLWIIPPNATGDFFLSATFTPPKDHPSHLNYYVWQGTLKLPKVKIPVPKKP